MTELLSRNLDYNRPVKLADDVYWVGFSDPERRLHCNPYLIVDDGEAVLIDGGSRSDFSMVMMKIMQTGIAPAAISTLIYQHYDPDLCGSLPNIESMIDRDDLRIISQHANNVFIRYYGVRAPMLCIDQLGLRHTLKSGRVLRFIPTPHAHAPGAFMTLDERTGILFTSDLFGGYDDQRAWELIRELPQACGRCKRSVSARSQRACGSDEADCVLPSILNFHREYMPSNKAVRHACRQLLSAAPRMVAPQHGSVLHRAADIETVARSLIALEDIGIDGVAGAG